MIKFVVRTDCHVHDKAPQSRVDDYLETCLQKLRQVGEFARRKGCDAVLDNGDFFHAKAATRNSHEMVRRVIELHRDYYPCPVYENPGNHDFPYNNPEYIPRQPLGVLFAAGIFTRMTDHVFEDPSTGLKVRVVGFPYKSLYKVTDFDIDRGDEDVLIACCHYSATPDGAMLFAGTEESLSYHDLAECPVDAWVFGHLHVDQGIQEVGGKIFMNLGSMTRGSLVQDNLTRVPRFGYIEIDVEPATGRPRINAEAVEYNVAPAEQVFDLERHDRLREEQRDIDKFIASLTTHAMADDPDDIYNTIRALSEFQQEVRDKAVYYLQKAMGE